MSAALEQYIKSVISIPEYYSRFIDRSVNLNDTPKVCCPFHKEDTPSFSYSPHKKVWSCFGSCKTGGDVINMHKKNKGFSSREEALESLASLLNVDRRSLGFITPNYEDNVDKLRASYMAKVTVASSKAKTVEEWVDLDYILSFNKPYSELIEDLDDFINRRVS